MKHGHPSLLIFDRPLSYSDRWQEICSQRGIKFEVTTALDRTLVDKLKRCNAFLWHWGNRNPDALMFARSIIQVAEQNGVLCFPDLKSCWHYDDKVAQSFLLSSIAAPVVNWEFFSNRSHALTWIKQATYPIVLKLRGGSGSRFVYKIDKPRSAARFCNKMFGRGIDATEPIFNDALIKTKRIKDFADAQRFLSALPRKLSNWRLRKRSLKERGYLYVQEFLPNNEHDTRITVIGERYFAFRRGVRPGDFRASGSGRINYEQGSIDPRCIQIAQSVADRLELQSCAFDFIFDRDNEPKIVEISYGFQAEAIHKCPGYYNRDMTFSEGNYWPQDLIMNDLLAHLAIRS